MPENDEFARPSHLRVVAENTPENRDEVYAFAQVERALTDLASNVLRVVRGAGRPYSIGPECVAFIDSLKEYRGVVGHYPRSEKIAEAITYANYREPNNAEWKEREAAIDTMIRGALQLAASRMLGQIPQERSGEHELTDGVRMYEDSCEKQRLQWQAAAKPKRATRPKLPRPPGPTK